jgi:uncharacterized protein
METSNKELKSGGEILSYQIISSQKEEANTPGVLFLNGLTGNKKSSYQYAESLAKMGYTSFLFNYRGHEESGGNIDALSTKDFLEDAEAAYDYLANLPEVNKEDISVIGTSMGSYIAILLSQNREVKNLILRAPSNYPDTVFNEPTIEHGGWNPEILKWRQEAKDHTGSMSLQALHDFRGNVLIIECGEDDMIPKQTVQNYLNVIEDKTKLEYILIEGAPHSIKEGKFRDQVTQIISDWFQSHLTPHS